MDRQATPCIIVLDAITKILLKHLAICKEPELKWMASIPEHLHPLFPLMLPLQGLSSRRLAAELGFY